MVLRVSTVENGRDRSQAVPKGAVWTALRSREQAAVNLPYREMSEIWCWLLAPSKLAACSTYRPAGCCREDLTALYLAILAACRMQAGSLCARPPQRAICGRHISI